MATSSAAHLFRYATGDHGTFGVLHFPGGVCVTVELPWRENAHDVSCIPVGDYECVFVRSRKYGGVYHVQGVPDRSGILIHSGNLAGDVSKGFLSHSHGCILPGTYNGVLGVQRAVLASRPALSEFNEAMGRDPFTLHIKELFQ